MDERQTQRAEREHRELKALKQRLNALQLQLSIEIDRRAYVERLLHECLTKKFYDEYKVSAEWLKNALTACPPIEGEKR